MVRLYQPVFSQRKDERAKTTEVDTIWTTRRPDGRRELHMIHRGDTVLGVVLSAAECQALARDLDGSSNAV